MRIAHWREMDAVMSVRLMARAYAGIGSARVFAPRGTLEEWATYLAQLIKMPACGAVHAEREPGGDGVQRRGAGWRCAAR